MSLRTQLWIAVAVIMLLSALVSIAVSTLSAQHYLSKQLQMKNVDNAASLALSLTQLPKEDAKVELAVAAQFDTGHYRLIRLTDPHGRVLQERVHDSEPEGVPHWFAHLMAFDAPPGIAHISDGWSQFGTLTVESQTTFAYESLWQNTRRLASIFIAGAILIGLMGTVYLHRCVRPLQDIVHQAEAMGQRRFTSTTEPATREFRAVAGAMNQLSQRIKRMLAEESARLRQLQARLQQDPVTGLLNREHFLSQLKTLLTEDSVGATGVMTLIRIQDLAGLKQVLGHPGLDDWLGRLANVLRSVATDSERGVAGRLNGGDFALAMEGVIEPEQHAAMVIKRLREAIAQDQPVPVRMDFGLSTYRHGDTLGGILARCDSALARAELGPGFTPSFELEDSSGVHHSQTEWAQAIRNALNKNGVQLATFPVVDRSGALMHTEAPVRLDLDGESRPAAYFLPWAVRVGLIRDLDDAVLDEALKTIGENPNPLAINLSTESLRDTAFRQYLSLRLHQMPLAASLLWLEFPARGALTHLAELRELCTSLAHSGCKIGIEHAGPEILDLRQFGELGLDYVKMDGTIFDGIHASVDAQSLVRSLCTVAHAIGVLIIAENCNEPQDLAILPELGVDGMTGTAVQIDVL